MKYCLYGNDIDASTNPIEAGLGWITKLDKDNFIGKEALVDAKANITRKLICIEKPTVPETERSFIYFNIV